MLNMIGLAKELPVKRSIKTDDSLGRDSLEALANLSTFPIAEVTSKKLILEQLTCCDVNQGFSKWGTQSIVRGYAK